jgi:4-amino-4-deoxy-L-arabinose transferase-like glycosyltransferase
MSLYRRALPWMGLLCVLAVYVISVVRLHPTNFFGLTQDDTVYFSSAKALADGQGYILPSVPGTPRATHYPVLYPWILSWVWRLNPSFPDNVADAVGLTVAFGCAFLSAAFLFFRQFNAFNDLEALLLTLFCGLQPIVRVYSANVLSDVPFAAFALMVIVLSNFALRRNPGTVLAAACGLLAGLTMFIRVLGVPIAAGILIAMLLHREWRKAAFFSACAAPFFAALAWRALFAAPSQAPVALSTCSAAWQGTWLSYTSYVGFWKIVSVHQGIFWSILKQNALLLLMQPGIYFADPRFIPPSILGTVFAVVLSATVSMGVFRLAKKTGWQPIHFSLALYVVPLLFWSYPIAGRCLIAFLPLFVGALWADWKRLVKRIWESLGRSQPGTERLVAALLTFALIVFVVGIGLSQERNGRLISRESQERGLLLPEKREAYSWLRSNTVADSKIIAYEDVSLFLFSNRQALRPLTFSPAALYDPSLLENDISCLSSGARAIRANYWVMSDDDFSIEWTDATSAGLARESQLGNSLPELFRSSSGRVRIYGLKAWSGDDWLVR